MPRPFPFILDWTDPGPDGRAWTLSGSDPVRVLTAKGGRITEWRGGRTRSWDGDPFAAIEEALREHAVAPDPSGAAVGYLGYDLGGRLENLPHAARDDRDFPDLFLAFHERTEVMERTAPPPAFSASPETSPVAASNFTRDRYLAAIEKARAYIAAGDIYQVNLSQRFHARSGRSPLEIYERLRATSPAPYSALLDLGGRAVVSSSPELFLHTEGRRVVTRPIKGTRPRGATPAEDARLRAELLASPKDDAELAMIVDLERNDLGRVCAAGSVVVSEPKSLETHPTVHHLVATVEGELPPGAGPVDLLRATFPGGSVTGAPKIRAMEIIDELEPTRRAAYTGAIGRIGFDGRVALSVAIRIVEMSGEDLWFQAGGGIVWDSDPGREYDETLVKAAGIARALGLELPS